MTNKDEIGQLFVVMKCWAGAETLIAHTTGNGGLRFSAHTNVAEAQASADQMNRDHYAGNNLCQVRPLEQRHGGVPPDAACFFKDGTAWCCVHGDFLNLQESPAGFGDTMEDALNELHAQCTTASVCRGRQSDNASPTPAAPAVPAVPDTHRPLGCALAMRVMQSDLFRQLDDDARADCDELVRQNLEWCKADAGVAPCAETYAGCAPECGPHNRCTSGVPTCDRCDGAKTIVTWGGGEQKPRPACGVQEVPHD